MLKLESIRECITLAQTLNFSRAAKQCFVTQPALSRHVAEVERELGVRLFDRDTQRVRLTEAGEAVIAEFQHIMASYETACDVADFYATGNAGSITIASPYYWTEDFTEPLVARLLESHPRCSVSVISCQPAEGLADVESSVADVCVVPLDNTHSELSWQPFSRERWGAVMLDTDPLAKRYEIGLSDLGDSILVQIDDAYYAPFNRLQLELLEARGIAPGSIIMTQQVDTLGPTIRSCGGVAIMPFGVRHMDRSYLQVIPLADEECSVEMCLAWLPKNDNPALESLVQVAAEIATASSN